MPNHGYQGKSLLGQLIDGLVAIIVIALVVNVLLGMLKPYVPFVIIGGFIYLVARTIYNRSGRW